MPNAASLVVAVENSLLNHLFYKKGYFVGEVGGFSNIHLSCHDNCRLSPAELDL